MAEARMEFNVLFSVVVFRAQKKTADIIYPPFFFMTYPQVRCYLGFWLFQSWGVASEKLAGRPTVAL